MGYAYPTEAHFARAVTPREYEELHTHTPDGLIGHPSLDPLVYADSTIMGVRVRPDRGGMIRGLRWTSEAGDTLTLDQNTTPGSTRIDLIVLRMTRNPWDAQLAVIKGVPSASPTAPTPTYGTNTATGVYEIPVAAVTVPYNASPSATVGPGQVEPRGWYVGDDGQLLCTKETRRFVPHVPGRRVTETDTGVQWTSNGSRWCSDQTGRVTVSFSARTSYTRDITFPSPYDQPPHVAVNIGSGDGSIARWGARAINISPTKFTLFVFGPGFGDTASVAWSSVPVSWHASHK